jgi:hypothetical protein
MHACSTELDQKNVKGWEMSIYRWKKNNKKPAPKPEKSLSLPKNLFQ